MKKEFIFLLLLFGLIASPSVYSQNLLTNSDFELGTLGPGSAPAGWTTSGNFLIDYNDPSSANNEPKGSANADKWINFDGTAGNNDSQDEGRAVGGRHRSLFTSSPLIISEGDCYTIHFEQSNPGLDNGGTGTNLWNGDGFWRFRLGGGSWVSGPTISVISTTGPLQWSTAKVVVTAGSGTQLEVETRRSGSNSYMEIDNIIMVTECDSDDLGSADLNALYNVTPVCYPTCTTEAQNQPGVSNSNPTSCDITPGDPDPTVIVEIPTFDCSVVESITFDTPTLPASSSVLYHYWGNCAPLSPQMPEKIEPPSNGYIQQMFCETDVFGLPAFPGGLSGENGIIDFLPKSSEDVGCNGFAEVGTCSCGSTAVQDEKKSELIQLDFWMAVPALQSQVGFRFSGNRQDAASFFVGADLFNMCEVAFFTDGPDHDSQVDQFSGTFNINGQLPVTCGLSWMRIRVYINDIADQFNVTPQINAGNGWVDIDQLLIEPALTADDNTVPTVTTTSVNGYLINGLFVYSDGGTWDPYGCNAVISSTDAGLCATLPVELVIFNAALKDKQIALKWQTASEENNARFEIEKSSDGRNWEIIGLVAGNGTTANLNNYTYLDKNPLIGDNFYRLKQIDYDGQFDFSDIITVRYDVKNIAIEVSPNPSPGEVNVTILNPNKEKMKIVLYDSAGILVWKSGVLSDLDIWKNEFNLTQKELYFISVQIGKETYAEKILIIE